MDDFLKLLTVILVKMAKVYKENIKAPNPWVNIISIGVDIF